MTAEPYAAPRRTPSAVRRTRAIVGAVLWLAVLVPVVLAALAIISGTNARGFVEWVARSFDRGLAGGPIPAEVLRALQVSPWTLIVLVLFAVAVVVATVAAIVTPTAIARRIVAPIVVALGIVPAWAGTTIALTGYQRLQIEPIAGGAMLIGLSVAVVVLGVWVGLGSTAGGLAAVPLTAFIAVLAPLAAVAVLTIAPGPGSNPLVSGPSRMLLSLHWVASIAIVASAVVAAFILLRTATYRRS